MTNKYSLIIFLLLLFLLKIKAQELNSPLLKGVKVLMKKEWYLNGGKLDGDTSLSAMYFNTKGFTDSSRRFNAKGEILDIWKNVYGNDNNIISTIHYSSYYKKWDTTVCKQNIPSPSIDKYDSKGNIIEQVYQIYPFSRRVLHYDNSDRYIGSESYNVKGKLIESDTKVYSNTGKLLEEIAGDEKGKNKIHRKNVYDQYDSLVMEVDSGSGRKVQYSYAMIHGKWRMTKETQHWSGISISSHKYIFYPDSSYDEVVRTKRRENGIKGLFSSSGGKTIYHYNPLGNKVLEETFFGKEVRKETFFNDMITKIESFYNGKLQLLTKYESGNQIYSLQMTIKGDTTNIDEWKYNVKGLLLREKHTRFNQIQNNGTGKDITGLRKDEEISEYSYQFY